MEESRWRKHVTWDDPDEISAKYEELSSKIDTVLKPLSISEFQAASLRDKGICDLKPSSNSLRRELDILSTNSQPRTPSKTLQKRHEKLVSEMKDIQSHSSSLSWLDVITNPETRAFLEQYFPKSSRISNTDFLAFLEFEFPHYVNSEAVKEEIITMLSLDQSSGCISLNALELLSRSQGLEEAIKQIYMRVDENIQENKELINSEILQEVTEIKEMLDCKSIELDKREARVLARENKLLRLESTLLSEFKEKLEKTAAGVKDKLAKEINVQMKRMQGLERNISDMIKLARSKQQVLSRSELSMKNSGTDSTAGKLKSRIAGLEKSNECLKTKLSVLELESKADKMTINKLNEEHQRIKARSSMLEQSLATAKKAEPEKPIEIMIPVKEEPKKTDSEVISMSPELSLVLSITSVLINCCRVTLPVVHGPPSPRSISAKTSIMEDPAETSLGEIFFPAFNVLVPSLAEVLPFVYKLKKKEDQEVLVKFLWELVLYAWSEEMPLNYDRKFYPNNLPFNPITGFWKHKLAGERDKASKRPVYQLFANLSVHKILGFYFLKWMNSRSSAETSLFSAFLLILTSTSKKRILSALVFLKNSINEVFGEADIKGCITVLVALLEYSDEIGGISCEILLALSVEHLSALIAQCCCENNAGIITEVCKKAVAVGMKTGGISDFEEALVVLIQKLSGQESLQIVIKQQGLGEVLMQRANSVPDNTFFQNNVNSIVRNLSN